MNVVTYVAGFLVLFSLLSPSRGLLSFHAWLKRHHALVDVANLLVLQQTIVTVPERPHPVRKLRASPLPTNLIHLVKIFLPESDKKQIRILQHLSKSKTEGPSTHLAQVSMMYLEQLTWRSTWKA